MIDTTIDSILGSIVTYELVLFQYNLQKIDLIMFEPCKHKPNNEFIE